MVVYTDSILGEEAVTLVWQGFWGLSLFVRACKVNTYSMCVRYETGQ